MPQSQSKQPTNASEASNDAQTTRHWHGLTGAEVCALLSVDPQQGLPTDEASRRLVEYGPNRIEEQVRRPLWRMFVDQFTDFMILVLIAAAVISGIVGEPKDAMAIVVIVALNSVIGFIQEYRAEKAVAALRRMAAPSARARRDGGSVDLKATDLVPGDIVLLEAGQVVPADLRLLEVAELGVGEAALTGESQTVNKATGRLHENALSLGDRINMAFKGTVVTGGRAVGVVVATGMATELGRIALLLGREETGKTPLQKRLAGFGRVLALAVLAISAIIFLAGLLRGEPLVLMFLTAVSLAVAAIPEALPAVVTVSLALGARKMVAQNALVRRLPAVETLGSVTYICSDKTGTLTQNIMRAEMFYADGRQVSYIPAPNEDAHELWHAFGHALAISNDATMDKDGALSGDPTETAFVAAAREAGYYKAELVAAMPRVGELPFDAERKRMTTLHNAGDHIVAYVKGAPENVLRHCNDVLMATGLQPLDADDLLAQAEALAAQGYRVLAFASRRWPALPDDFTPKNIETNLTFLGLAALIDPPRPEVAEAVRLCRSAGITPVMITGDHPATAKAIAVRLGIAKDADRVLTGRQLSKMPLARFERQVHQVPVYARVSPEQKIKIVNGLQDRGEFVAMTGDGVNDAPALKSADIGVAMGRKGTDVAREAADMVLLDDNFATIVAAVREGRRIYDNVRKFIKYTMTSNSGEIWTLFLAPFVGLSLPLLPIQILWINLVTDGLPGLALAAERHERNIMVRPPRPPNESVFAQGMWQYMLWMGLFIAGLSLFAQAWAESNDYHWQTIVFTVLTFAQLVNALAVRSERDSLFTIGFASNGYLLGAVIATVALQLAVIYVPFLNSIFRTEPLSAVELVVCFTLPWAVLVASEVEKWFIRRGWIYGNSQRHKKIEPRGTTRRGA